MTKHTHTPGPWRLKQDGPDSISIYAGDHVIGEVWNLTDNPENLANARLISAAPDMLEALEDMLAGWRYIRESHGDLYGVGWDRAEGKARAAIAKARGT